MSNKTEQNRLLSKLIKAKPNEVVGLVRATRTQKEAKTFKELKDLSKKLEAQKEKRRLIFERMEQIENELLQLGREEDILTKEILATRKEGLATLDKIRERVEYERRWINTFK